VQFKLAMHDKEWTRSVEVGQQIIREFPNTKMADEVRGMLDMLRQRAADEQAAGQRMFTR
jgi:outer membrane protein assembly factor BamD (BamD/ComL family)